MSIEFGVKLASLILVDDKIKPYGQLVRNEIFFMKSELHLYVDFKTAY